MPDSKRKGRRGEALAARELSALLDRKVRRGQQYKGSPDSPDIVGVPGVHFEVKYGYANATGLYRWMRQAIDDSGDRVPVVWFKTTNSKYVRDGSLVVVRTQDLLEFVRRIESANKG